jgi:hypothetical protein
MTRVGEARTCRSQARQGAHDRGRITEEPCEVETLMHGSEAEAGEVIPSSTVTRLPPASARPSLRLPGATSAEGVRTLSYTEGS